MPIPADPGRAADPAYQRARYEAALYDRFRLVQRWARYDGRYRLRLMEELFRRHGIPFERQRVFELGFGTGELLLRFDTTSALHGCEIAATAVRALEGDPRIRGYRDVALAVSAGDGAPVFPGGDYDVVIASHVIEHVPSDAACLEALAARTRPGGHGLFFLPLERPRHNPDHARTYTSAGFSRLLAETGWEVVEVAENFRYGGGWVQVVNWPSRRRLPVLGPLVEAVKTVALALPPTALVRLLEEPLARLHVAPYQLMALARRPE